MKEIINMKSIELFVEGKYDYKYKLGTWIYYLAYKNAVIKRSGSFIEIGSPLRSTLQALYMALGKINEPCEITIYSKIPLGFKTATKSKDKDLLKDIITSINKSGHVIKFELDKEFDKVSMWEQIYGKNAIQVKNNKDKKDNVVEKTAKPDIIDKNTPNDVFDHEDIVKSQEELRREWEDLLNDDSKAWVAGSGGY